MLFGNDFMLTSPLISVIVPVYKVEKYLVKCVDSIVNQTYKNLEIILVDDGSPDNCGKICDDYAAKDSRIKVIHKANGGLSDARNVAIDVASGDYITFIDSDDLINARYIETLYSVLVRYSALISSVSYKWAYDPREVIEEKSEKYEIYHFNANEAIENMLVQKVMLNSAWGKLYKRELFDGLRFTKDILYEDLDFFYKIYERSENNVHADVPLYFYRKNQESIIGSFNVRRLDVLKVTGDIVEYMKTKHPQLISAAESRQLSANFNMFFLLPYKESEVYANAYNSCWEKIKELRWKCLFRKHTSKKNRMGILLSILGKSFLRFALTAAKRV